MGETQGHTVLNTVQMSFIISMAISDDNVSVLQQ